MALPAWFAAMVQLPAETPVTVVPLTLQTSGVVVLKLTALPDAPPLALAVVVPSTATLDGAKPIAPMVCAALPMVMVCATWRAGLMLLSPAWFAAMVQLPAERALTVVPLTLQTALVSELKATSSPELAVALAALAPPTARVAGEKDMAPMLWGALLTVMLCVTCGAALLLLSPDWSAAMVQVPAERALTVEPLTLQTAGVIVLKATARPELAVALAVLVPPAVRVAGEKDIAPMLCAALLTVMFCVTCVAALLLLSPAWSAAMVQVPAERALTVEPATLQTAGVSELKATGRPEVAVAFAVLAPPTARVAGEKDIAPMLCTALSTVMFCVTCVAALKLAFPAWSAVMMQVPAERALTVEPLTVQTAGVVELKITARPEVAVALAVVLPPTASVAGEKDIVPMLCGALPTVMFCVTWEAALKFAFPAWSAAMVQVPAEMPVTVEPLTLQTAGVDELKVTARSEVAVALIVALPPTATVGAAPKVMVWPAKPAVMLRAWLVGL